MLNDKPTYGQLEAELNELRAAYREMGYQLEDANDLIEAIRTGAVDALVVKAEDGHQLYTLRTSDHAYRIFIEQMTTGAVTINRQGAVLYSNSRFADMVGLPLEKVTGKLFCNFVSTESHDQCVQLINSAWTESRKQELYLSGNTSLPVLLSLQTLQLEDGLAMSVIVTDLSAQKAQQKMLEEKNQALEQAQRKADELNSNLEQTVSERTKDLYANQQRLTRILETMAEGVCIIDTAGALTYANPMAQKILGLSLNRIKAHTYNDPQWDNLRLDGTPLPANEHPMAVMMTTGQALYDQEIGIQPPNRERFYISINAAPVRDENGNIVAGIGTFMDVTHRRKATQQKDEFISVASHELKTPITSLKASLQLLDRMKNQPSPAMLVKLVDQSNRSLNKVSTLIEYLLNATKVTEGQLQLNKKIFPLKELIDDCCNDIRTEGGYELISEGETGLQVNADPDKCDQVLVNLVNNAVKYAFNSKVISIKVERAERFAKVMVIDQGPGVPPDKLPHLFERYYRADDSSQQYSGLGLGLYICAEIVKKHGGQIGVDSKLGEGSSFWFTLPLAG
ncbi:ATP-binding protein [Mucilaginibacter sp. dw_454]|uniref:PAS domain-containing sensor histidine kinase n=1 Tax=Mucilaginibacter sp. dw_454 TaxID=2720079 RepID=UPI001BD4FCF7|nr:ATP-binding protein [Mucilaginibacter sp. dw_454]